MRLCNLERRCLKTGHGKPDPSPFCHRVLSESKEFNSMNQTPSQSYVDLEGQSIVNSIHYDLPW